MRRSHALAFAVLAYSCSSPQPLIARRPPEPTPLVRSAIVACGISIPIDVPVVLWTEAGAYDATSTTRHFAGTQAGPRDGSLRYTPGRQERGEGGAILVEPESTDLQQLGQVVDLLVLHYDACGTSQRCFEVLHDIRGLSIHFMLDLDGTLYQTMDLRDQAWHAREANPRSIGIEIANLGAFRPGEPSPLQEWYKEDALGTRIVVPAGAGVGGRGGDFIARPARPEPVVGSVQGERLLMYDLTPEQYNTLVRLTAVLCKQFPRIIPDAPRDRLGRVRTTALSTAELNSFHGILGHYHITTEKLDPGPAFDWEQYLARVRTRVAVDG